VKLATIINYCTNDARFLKLCVDAVKPFSSQILIPVCDHFFDGTPENRGLLNRSYHNHPDCTFVEYQYTPQKPYGIYCPYSPADDDWIHFWHSTSRYVGFHFLSKEITHVLFLDVDEIVDTKRFQDWLKKLKPAQAWRFSSYFYFRQPIYRAYSHSLNALLIEKEALVSPELLLTIYERKGIFDAISGVKYSNVVGQDHTPLFHHYSWVRTKEELFKKVHSWGHHAEKNWQELLTKELSQEFTGEDHLYHLKYERVEPLHDPFSAEMVPLTKKICPPNCIQVSPQKLYALRFPSENRPR
jgi:hypothetical protein